MNARTQSGHSRPSLAYVVCRLAINESDEDQQARETYVKFLAVLTKNPRPGTALEKVIEYHTDNGTVDEFIQQLRDDAAANTTSWMIVGLLEAHRQKHAEAVAAFEQAEAKRPDDALPSWMLGRSLAELDRHADAAVALERAITKNPDRATLLQIYQDLGRAYRRAQQPDKANDVWQRMETKFPSDVRVKEQIAATLLDEGDFEKCLRRYEELATLQTDPSLAAQSRMVVGDLQMKLGQTEAARKTFEDVMSQLDSESWLYRDARRRIEDLFAQQDNPDALITYYDQWLKDHPEDLDAMVRLARSLAGQFRYDEARRWYSTAIEKAPSRVDLRKAMIEQWLREDNVIAAIDEYQRLAELDPANTDHLEAWGLLCLKRNDQPLDQRKAAAKVVWMKLLQDFESDATRHLRVADLFRRADLLDDALAYYQKAVELSNGDPPAVESLAQCLMAMNRRDDAIATLRQLAEGTRRSTANLLQLATSFVTIDEVELALQATREACELTPSFQDRLLLVRRLRDFRKDGQHPFAAESLDQLAKAEALVESDEDRRLIRDEKILCLTTAGQMESQIEALARSNSERDDVSVDDWTTLASYYTAIGRRPEASEAISKALAIHADNVEALSLAAALYEETGRLQDAADARRRLKGLDRRRQSEHLSKLVNLERRLHQTDAAFATAKELLNATPGNPDAVNLYADLCFQSNRPDEGLNALRRLVRSNPSDQEARFRLAEMLTQLQRTTEAEEFWWQTLLATEDRTLQEQIVTSLADLALKSERLDVLLKRLEQRGRELNRRTDAARWRAAAFRKVEDFVSARQSLESVLTEDKQDVEILQQLSSLCELMGDLNAAIEFQRRIEAAAPSDDGKLRLTTLLIQSGEMTEADALLARVAKLSGSSPQLMKAIDQLTEAQEFDAAKQLCERVLTEQPNHWLVLQKLIVIEWQRGNFEAVDALVERVLEMQLSWRTPMDTLFVKTAAAKSTTHLDDLFVNWPYRVTPNVVRVSLNEKTDGISPFPLRPSDYGDVRVFCLEIKRRRTIEMGNTDQWFATLEQRADSDRTAAWDRWALEFLNVDYDYKFSDDELSDIVMRRLDLTLRLQTFGDIDADLTVLDAATRLFYQSHFGRFREQDYIGRPLSDDRLARILQSFEVAIKEQRIVAGSDASRAVGYLCQMFKQEVRLKKIIDQMQSDVATRDQLLLAFDLLRTLSVVNTENRIRLASRILQDNTSTIRPAIRGLSTTMELANDMFASAIERGSVEDMERVMTWWVTQQHELDPLTSNRNARFMLKPSDDRGDEVRYRRESVLQLRPWLDTEEPTLITVFHKYLSAQERSTSVVSVCEESKAGSSSCRIAWLDLVQAVVHWHNKSPDAALVSIAHAAELVPEDVGLKMRVIDLCQLTGRLEQALSLVERLPDSNIDIIREKHLKMLELSTRLKNVDKAQIALGQLSGLLLDPETQTMILSCLKTLNLTDEANQFQASMGKPPSSQPPRRGYVQASPFLYGKRLEALRKGDNKTATVDFAKQILRRTQNAAWFSGRSSEDRDKLREQAFDVLKEAGELDQIIERRRAAVQASPQSAKLTQDLVQTLRAAGRDDEADEVRAQWLKLAMAGSPSSLVSLVKQLDAENDSEAAEAAAFKLLETYPDYFWSSGETSVDTVLMESEEHLRIAEAAVQFVSRNPSDANAIVNAQAMAVEKISKFAQDSSRKAETLLDQLFANTSEVSASIELHKHTKLWTTPQTFRALSKLMIPRTEADALAPRYGWSDEKLDLNADREPNTRRQQYLRLSAIVQGLQHCFKDDFRRDVDQAELAFPQWRLALTLRLLFAIAEKNLDEAHLIVEQMQANSNFQIAEVPAYEFAVLLIEQGEDWKPLALDVLKRCIETSPVKIRLASPVVDRLVSLAESLGRTDQARHLIDTRVDWTMNEDVEKGYASWTLVRLDNPIAALRLLDGEEWLEDRMRADAGITQAERAALFAIRPAHVIRDLKQSLATGRADLAMLMGTRIGTDKTTGMDQLQCTYLDRVLIDSEMNEPETQELADVLKQALAKQSAEPAVIALAVGFLLASDQNAAIQSVQPELELWWQRPVTDVPTNDHNQRRVFGDADEFLASAGVELCLLACFSEFKFDESRRPVVKGYFNYCERLARNFGDRKLLELVLTTEAEYYDAVNEIDAAKEIRERISVKPGSTIPKENVDAQLQRLLK